MSLCENQRPNICDGCGKRTTIVHFHTKKDDWIALCRECQQSITSMLFSTATEKRLKSIIDGLKAKHGQDNIVS